MAQQQAVTAGSTPNGSASLAVVFSHVEKPRPVRPARQTPPSTAPFQR